MTLRESNDAKLNTCFEEEKKNKVSLFLFFHNI